MFQSIFCIFNKGRYGTNHGLFGQLKTFKTVKSVTVNESVIRLVILSVSQSISQSVVSQSVSREQVVSKSVARKLPESCQRVAKKLPESCQKLMRQSTTLL